MKKDYGCNMNLFQTILFYTLSFTWGILPSLVGLVVILCLAPFKRVHVFHNRLYAVVGKNWGGLELGCFFVVAEYCQSYHTLCHESGHGFQNALWGPATIFLVFIPSAIRYWYRELKYNRKGKVPPTSYDSIWFEGQATRWGKEIYKTL